MGFQCLYHPLSRVGEEVPVDVDGDPDRGVTQAGLCFLWVYSRLDQLGRMGMAEVVEGDAFEAGASYSGLEVAPAPQRVSQGSPLGEVKTRSFRSRLRPSR